MALVPTSVVPYLVVHDAQRMVDFLEAPFGASVKGEVHRHQNDSIKHVELKVGDGLVMVGGVETPESATQSMFFLSVQDVDRAYEAALQAGGTMVEQPHERHERRMAAVRDYVGNQWWFGSLAVS